MNKAKNYLTGIIFLFVICTVNAQEALKSIEEEYYDFLSLTGVVERPTLGYRTLSDNVWNFNEVTTLEENEDGTYTKVRVPGYESEEHIWKKNNLGTTYTLCESSSPADNLFARGLKQGITARIYGPEWFNSYNTAAPYGQNDGGLWQGRGYNTALTAGLRLEGYGFELTFKPQVSWSQNKEFDHNSDIYPSPYSYSFKSGTVTHIIDVVQRYGDDPFWNFDWGDTEARWTWNSLTFGVGTQNPWLGPAYLNPMLGSNNAGGYLKFDAGLRKLDVILPWLDWNLGTIEGRIWVGRLEESDYFDFDTDYKIKHEPRMLTAMSASYAPSFIPGLTIGLNRIFLTYWRAENLSYILRLFTASRLNALASSGNDEDQKFALFAEWKFPKVGFEIYGEFGRDDFSSNEKANPFHTAIYTVGAKQIIPLNLTNLIPTLPKYFNLTSELVFEWNNFEMSQDFQLQWTYMGYYAHGFVKQGYTQKGQLLGAGTGWAGNSQFLQYKIYYPKGYTAFSFHRYCQNNNSIYSQAVYTTPDTLTINNKTVSSTWHANFETYICYGIKTNIYLLQNLNLTFMLNDIKLYIYQYQIYKSKSVFNFVLDFKYSF